MRKLNSSHIDSPSNQVQRNAYDVKKQAAESFRSIKGTFDVLPTASSADGRAIAGSAAWRHVERTVVDVLGRYGAREIRTPILEPTALIARGIGQLTDIVSKEMFAFEREDTHYVLRPEVTAPVMRAYLQHHLDQERSVQKLFYIGPCFRAERPQKGRYRQFHQFGVEYIGTDAVRADAEVITMMVDVYHALGIDDLRLRVNTLGDENARPAFKEALQSYLRPFADDLSETSRRRLDENPLRILDTKNPRERELLEEAPSLINFVSTESRDRYDALLEMLDAVGIRYIEDPFLVRGLDYYTETAFELESDLLDSAQSALAGGGRYDLLASEIGAKNPTPAVGFAAGIERLFLALESAGKIPVTDERPDIFVVLVDNEGDAWATSFAHQLRAAGVSCEIDLSGRSVKAQMREANRVGAKHVIVVGETERASGSAKLKNMADGTERDVSLSADEIRLLCIPD